MPSPYNPTIPFFHPCSTLILDDDEDFLQSIRAFFSRQFASFCYSSPGQAMQKLFHAQEMANELHDFFSKYAPTDDHIKGNDGFVHLKSSKLHQYTQMANRFKMVSVVIVDYQMPTMTGLEFCRTIADLPVKKILLTGKANTDQIINAFNEGVIDRFISKSDADVLSKITQMVKQLHQDFISDTFSSYAEALKAAHTLEFEQHDISVILDQAHEQFPFSEYYFLPRPRSFMLRNTQGEAKLCLLSTVDELNDLASIAEKTIGDIPSIHTLKSGKAIAWGLLDWLEGNQNPSETPENIFFPCHSYHDWRWALLPPTMFSEQQGEPILSWNKFRQDTLALSLNETGEIL